MSLKKMLHTVMQVLGLAALMIQGVFADDVTIVGTMKHALRQSHANSSLRQIQSEKVIQLLQIQLSDEATTLLANRAKDALIHSHQFSLTPQNVENSLIPNKVLLGMNNVPVLDQGRHGTCVTFAVTGAVDAVIGKGDYISQLCNLQLGSYLEMHGYGLSGWDGSHAITVINQMEQFGIINKQKQKIYGCGGMNQYPTNSTHDSKSFMEPEKYRALSELIFGNLVNWSNVYQKNEPVKTLNEVKEILHSRDRLVFAVLLPRTDLGIVGAVGKYKTWIDKDTWVLTPEILAGTKNIKSAHEMIITGYDDNAVAIDNNGKKHTGLLKLRNSWGSSVGDSGEFYMSYDYFKLLAFDVTRLSPHSL